MDVVERRILTEEAPEPRLLERVGRPRRHDQEEEVLEGRDHERVRADSQERHGDLGDLRERLGRLAQVAEGVGEHVREGRVDEAVADGGDDAGREEEPVGRPREEGQDLFHGRGGDVRALLLLALLPALLLRVLLDQVVVVRRRLRGRRGGLLLSSVPVVLVLLVFVLVLVVGGGHHHPDEAAGALDEARARLDGPAGRPRGALEEGQELGEAVVLLGRARGRRRGRRSRRRRRLRVLFVSGERHGRKLAIGRRKRVADLLMMLKCGEERNRRPRRLWFCGWLSWRRSFR